MRRPLLLAFCCAFALGILAGGSSSRPAPAAGPRPHLASALSHLTGGFQIGTPAMADDAAADGVGVAFNYGLPTSPQSALGQELTKLHMSVISASPQYYLYLYQCHLSYTKGKPWSPCSQDYPQYTLSYTLSTIQSQLQSEASNPLVIGYWILDDWNYLGDPGGAAAILPQITQMVHSMTGKQTICGFGGEIDPNKQYSWSPVEAENFSPAGCDMVATYVYSSSVLSASTDPSAFDWSMSALLPAMFSSLQGHGWDIGKEPLIGIGQGWAGTRTDLNPQEYEIVPTADDMIEQAISFVHHGATGVVWYGWSTSGLNPLYTPQNTAQMRQGVRQGIASAQTYWGMRPAFQSLPGFTGIGPDISDLVGPGPGGTQDYYASYYYPEGSFDVVAVDPNAPGAPRVLHSPVGTESAARGLVVGPDGEIYLGTAPNGHLMRLDPQTQTIVDLGTVPRDPATGVAQGYVWQLTLSPYDHELYGCTYPSADLVSYDPLAPNPAIVNLGSADPTGKETYARYCLADPDPQSPYVYVGLGSATGKVAAFDIATGRPEPSPLLSNTTAGSFGDLYTAAGSAIYGSVASGQYCQLGGGAVGQCTAFTAAPTNVFSSGASITLDDQSPPPMLTITSGGVSTTYPYAYAGQRLSLDRLALGPAGDLYGASADLAYLVHADPAAGSVQAVGYLGRGHEDALLTAGGALTMAGDNAVTMGRYDPTRAFNLGTNPNDNRAIEADLTPTAMLYSPVDNNVYTATTAAPGQLQGWLNICDAATVAKCTSNTAITHEGVTSLTLAGEPSGPSPVVVGGTTIYGGAGTTPYDSLATIFVWYPQTEQRGGYVDVPGVATVTDLVYGGECGGQPEVYGVGRTTSGGYELFSARASGGSPSMQTAVSFPYTPVANSIGIGPDGNLWGLASQGIFEVNVQGCTPSVTLAAAAPAPITGGFAIDGNTLFSSSGSVISSYTIS